MPTMTHGNLKRVEIDYIEVEMPSGCSACDDAISRLNKAIEFVSPIMAGFGIEPSVRRIKVRTSREAELLRIWGSPTIRIGSTDLHPEHRNPPEATPDEASENRVWHWRGEEHSQPPVEMLTEALLKLAVDPAAVKPGDYEIPSYLRRFIADIGATA